ncbi:MAG: hypothetical protein LBJ72_01965, partial [Dysgonamonadaceae bacterium]|nr:hypothetical protein [Dysgonamonadaceae bacterium]
TTPLFWKMNYGEGDYRVQKTGLNSNNSAGLCCCKLRNFFYIDARASLGKSLSLSLSNINDKSTKFKVLNLAKKQLKQG